MFFLNVFKSRKDLEPQEIPEKDVSLESQVMLLFCNPGAKAIAWFFPH